MDKNDVLDEAVEMLIRKVLEQSGRKSTDAGYSLENSLRGENNNGLSSAAGTSK